MEGEFPVAGSLILLREESDGRAVLLHRESGASVAINPVGVAVWKRLDGRRSAAEIAAGIRDHFSGVPGTASEEIGDFLDQLVELGFVDAEAGRYRWLTGQTEDGGVPGAVHTAEIMITARCNLRCRYCSFFDDPSITYRDLPTGDWLQFFEELGRCGAKVVSLSGGEPFIREDLPQLLDGIVGNGMLFMIGSNGALIDDRIAAHIAATEHCDHVWVSVDGSHAETHDSFRGQGSFEGAIRGIRILQRHGVNTVPRMVIHRRNVRDMEAMARFLLEELHVPLICMTDAYAYGTGRFHAEEMLLTAAERATAMATLFRLREKYNGRIDANHGPLAWGLKWRRMEEARAEGQPAFPAQGT